MDAGVVTAIGIARPRPFHVHTATGSGWVTLGAKKNTYKTIYMDMAGR
jgi:hypothetical protein